jgi:glyoxylase-like metal-dependent hydrolase (beta-lactamase superfamily II)/ferredoxin
MANRTKKLDTNVAGNFYVDATCINCDTCRQLAPKSFEEVGEYSAVRHQPENEGQIQQAYQALLACPVGSIGTEHRDKQKLNEALASFPLRLEGGVHYCGFNSEQSFGANSYFVTHPNGNWLIDSPRYIKHLVDAFERMGGVAHIFLTHEDDVADADRYAKHFGAKRIIHRADAAVMPDAEWIVDGFETIQLTSQFQLIPVPGHTVGSCALLYDNRFLFTGDHLWWDPETQELDAPKRLVWKSRALLNSIQKLLDYRFEWVLAGHGDRIKRTPEDMQRLLHHLMERRCAAIAS